MGKIKIKMVILMTLAKFLAPYYQMRCWLNGIRYDRSWHFLGTPHLRRGHGGRIRIGKNFTACSLPWRNALGVQQPVMCRTVAPGAELVIGDDVGMSGCTVSAAKSIQIGNRVTIGSGALIMDSDYHPLNPLDRQRSSTKGKCRPVVIRDDVFIGARAIITKGVTIGEAAVVAAGAVVVHDVEPWTIAGGNPAKKIGDVPRSAGSCE